MADSLMCTVAHMRESHDHTRRGARPSVPHDPAGEVERQPRLGVVHVDPEELLHPLDPARDGVAVQAEGGGCRGDARLVVEVGGEGRQQLAAALQAEEGSLQLLVAEPAATGAVVESLATGAADITSRRRPQAAPRQR